MNKSAKDLLSAWRGINLSKSPFILNGDHILIEKGCCHSYSCFNDYISDSDFGIASPHKIHAGLIPIPYAGDILNANIYILALNPGFGPHDYYAESYNNEFRKARIQQLRQEHMDNLYPWSDLNPLFCWHGGWKYWTSRLGDIINKLSEQKRTPYKEALMLLSKNIACLEYVPYHSKSYGIRRSIVDKMLSSTLMKAFVHDYVVPKAIRGDAIIVVTRHVDVWELPQNHNIVTYNAAESRAAYLNLKSPGGKMIAKIMGLKVIGG